MRKIFLSICLMFISAFAFGQWTLLNPSPTNYNLTSVYFSDVNTGYAVGDSGTILKTTDGGINWLGLSTGTTDLLNSVCFTDVSTGYAVGGYIDYLNGVIGGTILKTTDGGTTWNTLSSDTLPLLKSVFFTDANTGYAVGSGHAILKTNDSGTAWSILSGGEESTPTPFNSVYFVNADIGYAVGWSNRETDFFSLFFKTSDGGTTWTPSVEARYYYVFFNSVYFIDAYTGYVVGTNGTILKTIDGGTTFTVLSSGTANTLSSVYFTDTNTGYVVGGDGTIIKTTNAGETWTALSSGTTNDLSSVYFTDANTGYAAGSGGVILKTTNGGGFVSISEPVLSESAFTIYPNLATHKITISTNRTLPGETSISITSISGQQLRQAHFQKQEQFDMDVSTLSKGIYLVKILNNARIKTKKLVIQ